jgi:predicted nucleic acid-binding protein
MKAERICLDTDILQDYLMNKKEALEIVKRLQKSADCATTPLTLFELYCMAARSEKEEENTAIVQSLAERIKVLQWTPMMCKQAAKLFTELQKLNKKPNIRNIFVGVLTKEREHILLTNAKDDYAFIPGLKLYK